MHPNGIRHVRADKRINDWKAPGKQIVTKVAANEQQVVIGLSGGSVIYFELDVSGQLLEVEKLDGLGDINSLALSPLEEGRQRARFLVRYFHKRTLKQPLTVC